MRFLFILERHRNAVEAVVSELGVGDVEVVPVGKKERAITKELLERVAQTSTGITLCEIDRSYRKSLGELPFDQQIKSFRPDDQILREWLRPPPPADAPELILPSVSFEAACARAPRLILADGALESADEIAVHRYAFATKAADLLARHAADEDVGRMRDWGAVHGVHFAVNGQVEHSYHVPGQHKALTTEWHLSEGKKTTAEGAARIYFDTAEVAGVVHTVVLYVGPHPPSGTYKVTFNDAQWQAPSPAQLR